MPELLQGEPVSSGLRWMRVGRTACAASGVLTATLGCGMLLAQAAGEQGATTTLRTNVRRVVVDVVVTDAKGHPVTGLSKGDFSVSEDNVPQSMRSFEVHTVAAEAPYVPPKLPKLPPNTFLNLAMAPETGTPTVLLYDVLNTPSDSLAYAHAQMVKYLKHRKPGTQVAIFVLSDKLRLLQGFTDDTDQLTRALNTKRGEAGQSTLLSSGGASATTADSLAPAQTIGQSPGQDTTARDTAVAGSLAALANMEALEQSALLDRRVEITLDGLTEIGRFLAGLPGRKNLVWLSGSFPAGILPDPNVGAGSLGHDQSIRNYSQDMKEATDLLNLSHVAVYPVDARGLITDPAFSAASKQQFGPGTRGNGQAVQAFGQKQSADHATMDSIADSTGGRAFYNTNDLQEAIGSAAENGSTYYSITYAPTNGNFDGSLRRIRVKLQQGGYKLAYRTTYFADDLARAATAAADAPQSPLTPALEHGTPVSHEIFIEAHLETVGTPVPATPQQMQLLSEYEAMRSKKKGKGGAVQGAPVLMQGYVIAYGVLARQLEMESGPDGVRKLSLDVGLLSYDAEGRKLNGIETTVEDAVPPARYAKLLDEGYHVLQTMVIPVTATSVRLAVRDVLANRIGSLEVPLPLTKTP